MTTRRLIDQTQDALALRLLRSAELDVPPRGSLSRTAAAIGISSAAVVGTATLGAGLHATGIAGTTSKAMLSLVLKGLLVGGVTGTVVVGAGVLLSRIAEDPSEQEASVVASAPPTEASPGFAPQAYAERRSAASAATSGTGPIPEIGFPEPASSSPTPAFGAKSDVAAFADRDRAKYLADEVKTIDRARQLVRTGRAAEALAELERYEQSSPTRELAAEASVLRVEALVALGRRSEAAALARRLLQGSPDGGGEGPRKRYLESVADGG